MVMRRLMDVKKAVNDFFTEEKEGTLDAVVRNYYLLPENEKVGFFAMISEYGFWSISRKPSLLFGVRLSTYFHRKGHEGWVPYPTFKQSAKEL